MIQINLERHYDGMSFLAKNFHNERQLDKAKNKFNSVTSFKSKVKALLEEIHCYFIRNQFYHENFCDFNTYVQHWTLANRGRIRCEYLDEIEKQFGKLAGPLYIIPRKSSWNTDKNWRTTNE